MVHYTLSRAAEKDIADIYSYIEQDNATAARRVAKCLEQTFTLLAEMPAIGRLVEQLEMPGVRIIPVRSFANYVVVYMVLNKAVHVVRVLHACRDIPTILEIEFTV